MGKFEYKNEAELKDMTSDQRDAYATKKREHEKALIKTEAESASQKLIDALKEELKDSKAISKDSDEYKAMEQKISDLEELTKNLDKSVEDLGKTKQVEIPGVTKKVGAIFQEKHKAMIADGVTKGEKDELFNIETKAFDSLNVHSVSTVAAGTYPTSGTVSAMGDTYRSVYSQIIGIFNVPRVYSKIMDKVDVSPLVAETLIAFNETITSGFAITPECTEKPVSKIVLSAQTVTANPVASLFYTTLHMRRFYPSLVNRFVQTFNTLLNEAIPNHVMSEVRTNAVAYTHVAALTWTAPSYFEAIVATAASLKKLGYMPDTLCLSPIAYALMITELGSNGQYKLQNGSSIVLVDDTIKIGSENLQIVEDAELGDDEFLLGDAFKAVKVGLDSQVLYFETDGVTDNQNVAPVAPATGLSRNVRTHELAQFVAVMLPDGAKGALVRDTFANVISQITSP